MAEITKKAKFQPEVVKQIENFAKEKGMSVSDVIRNGTILYITRNFGFQANVKDIDGNVIEMQIQQEIEAIKEAEEILEAIKERNALRDKKEQILDEIHNLL